MEKHTEVIKYVFVYASAILSLFCAVCSRYSVVSIELMFLFSLLMLLLMLLLLVRLFCWYSLEPKVIFDYRSLHRVKGKKENIIQTIEVLCVLYSRKLGQVCLYIRVYALQARVSVCEA